MHSIKLDDLKKNTSDKFADFCPEYRHSSNLTLDKEKVKAYYFYMEKGAVKVKERDVKEGIPFDSFLKLSDEEDYVLI